MDLAIDIFLLSIFASFIMLGHQTLTSHADVFGTGGFGYFVGQMFVGLIWLCFLAYLTFTIAIRI